LNRARVMIRRFDILTLFPEMFQSFLEEALLKRGQEKGLVEVHLHQIRDWTSDRHRTVDDMPYGGGDGMVMKPDALADAIRAVQSMGEQARVTLLSPQGLLFRQELAWEFSKRGRMILVCGRYAGIDERVRRYLVDEELSIGDYVLSGGELAAMVVIEAVARLIPGMLGNEESTKQDSFPTRLEHPQYTRPADFEGHIVPEVLTSGDHARVRRWQKKESLRVTLLKRPDLLEKNPPDKEEREFLEEIRSDTLRDRKQG
jgi:tRNA (guanine37-N1)-methyltransferase